MRIVCKNYVFALFAAAILTACSHTRVTESSAGDVALSSSKLAKGAIPVGQLKQPNAVLGDIGLPLGSVVKINADVLDMSQARAKALEGVTFLRIRSVDGRTLNPPCVIKADWFSTFDRKTLSGNVNLVGYESAGFSGFPAKASKYVLPIASQGFHFENYFVILKIADPKR